MDLANVVLPDVLVDLDTIVVKEKSWRTKVAAWTKDLILPRIEMDPSFVDWLDTHWMDWKDGNDAGIILFCFGWSERGLAHAMEWLKFQERGNIFRDEPVRVLATQYDLYDWMRADGIERAYVADALMSSPFRGVMPPPWRWVPQPSVEDLITMQRRTRRKKY